jgi:hypothetical protein
MLSCFMPVNQNNDGETGVFRIIMAVGFKVIYWDVIW